MSRGTEKVVLGIMIALAAFVAIRWVADVTSAKLVHAAQAIEKAKPH